MATRQFDDKSARAGEPRAVDLREYWQVVRRRWGYVVVAALAGAALAGGYAHYSGHTYTATAEVLVAPVTQGPLNLPSQVTLLVNMSTEQAVAQSGPVIDQAATLMHVKPTVLQTEAAKDLAVSVPTTSDVLQISWQAKTAKAAQAGANAFANAYLSYRHAYLASQIASLQAVLTKQVKSLQAQISHAAAQLSGVAPGAPNHQSLSIGVNQLTNQLSNANSELTSLPTYNDSGGQVIPSSLPLSPSGLGRSVLLVMGGILGLLIGLLIAFTRDVFDDRVRDSAQFERKLGAATLAVLPSAGRGFGPRGDGQGREKQWSLPVAFTSQPEGRAAETIRWLRGTLVAVAGRTVRTILVVGADTSVSSSRVVAELGVALAESGRSVLLIAADVHGSALPQIFGLSNKTGLLDVLDADGTLETLARHPKQAGARPLPPSIHRRLAVLASGSATEYDRSFLDSDAMAELLERQRDAYEFVLLDCPPAIAADVVVLAAQVDGVIALGREGRTKGRALDDLRRLLDQVGANLIGGVFIGSGRMGRHRYPNVHQRPEVGAPRLRPERGGPGLAADEPKPLTQPLPVVADNPVIRSSGQGAMAKRPL
jgi:Mrp family chromosome partitioning ATPase/capsular polysaccharide biosynthesis protein